MPKQTQCERGELPESSRATEPTEANQQASGLKRRRVDGVSRNLTKFATYLVAACAYKTRAAG